MAEGKTNKRPISITLVVVLAAALIVILLLNLFIKESPGWITSVAIVAFSFISMLISVVLIFLNTGKNRRRMIAFIISSVIFFILTILSSTLLVFYMLYITKIEYEPVEEIEGDKIKTIQTPGVASDIFVDDNYVYTADGKGGLQIIDISSIENLQIVGSCGTEDRAVSVYMEDNSVYLADRDGGLKIIDVSKKEAPEITGTYSAPGLRINDVSVSNNHAFTVYRKYDNDSNPIESGIQIINVTDKENPYLAAEYPTENRAEKISVFGDHVFLICNDGSDLKSIESELLILDIINPEEPVLTGRCTIDCYNFNLFIKDDYVYTASDKGMYIIDISDKENPAICGKFLSYASTDLFIEGDTAYIIFYPPAGGDMTSLYIIDVFLKENPVFVDNILYPVVSSNSLFVNGDYIYIAGDDILILKK